MRQPLHRRYLEQADKGFAGVVWAAHWQTARGATVIATSTRHMRRAWPAATCTWAAGKR